MAGGLFGGGNGTSTNPYLIEDASDLFQIKNHKSSYFKLMSNINLGEPPFNKDYGWEPISGFTGYVDGNNKRIYNLTIVRSDSDNVGFFADYSATSKDHYTPISNVSFENVGVRGKVNVGAVIGKYTTNSDAYSYPLNNVYVSGSVEGDNCVGSFIGRVHYAGAQNKTLKLTLDCCTNAQLGITNADSTYIGQIVGLVTDTWSGDNATANTSAYFERTVGRANVSKNSRKVIKQGNFTYDLNAKDRFKDCFMDTSYWQMSDFKNPHTGFQCIDSSLLMEIETQAPLVNVMNADGKTHKWATYDNTYPELVISLPDYIFIKADNHFFTYDFVAGSWEEIDLVGNKKMPTRNQAITKGIRTLQDIPSVKWDFFKKGFAQVDIYDVTDKTDTTFQHNVPVNNSLMTIIEDSAKQSTNEKKVNMSLKVDTSNVYGVLSAIKGW